VAVQRIDDNTICKPHHYVSRLCASHLQQDPLESRQFPSSPHVDNSSNSGGVASLAESIRSAKDAADAAAQPTSSGRRRSAVAASSPVPTPLFSVLRMVIRGRCRPSQPCANAVQAYCGEAGIPISPVWGRGHEEALGHSQGVHAGRRRTR